LVFIGIARADLLAGNTKSSGRDPRSPACDRGQFAATAGRRTCKNAAVAAYPKWLLEAGLRHDVELANADRQLAIFASNDVDFARAMELGMSWT
jgi:hypothetical protein